MFIVHRTGYFAWIILLILLFLFSSMNWSWLYHSSDNGSTGPSSATGVVEENGFTLALAGITISADADIAPVGTQVHAELITPEIPTSIIEFAEPVGIGVEITLADDRQPATPLSITFAPSEVATWYATTEGDDDLLPVVFASNERELGVEFADAHLMANGSVVVTADHLSEFYPGVTKASSFSNWMVGQMATAIGARSDEPACFNDRTNDSEWAVLGIIDQVFWPCVKETPIGVDITLSSNTSVVWMVSSSQASPSNPGSPGLLTTSGLIVALGTNYFIDHATTGPVIPPDGSVSFGSSLTEGEIVFDAKVNYGLSTVHSVLNTGLAIMPASKAKLIIDEIGKAECILAVIQEAAGGIQPDGSLVGTVLDCVGAFLGGMGGTVFSSITAVPGATVAMAEATYRTLAGTDQFSFTLSKVNADSSAWPTDRDDSVGGLYIWLGANFYNFPDWVACDDAKDWCVVGYNGERHLLIKTGGLEAMYWIDDNVPSPRDALLSTGLSEDVVSEILGD